jgi:hypothetical protein
MKVHELIAQLQTLERNKEVFMWVDGERYPIADVDPMDWYIDLNADMGVQA